MQFNLRVISITLGLSLSALQLLWAAPTRASAGEEVPVTINALNCRAEGDQTPITSYSSEAVLSKASPTTPDFKVRDIAPGTHQLSFSIPAGRYLISVLSSKCFAKQFVTILPGVPRHLVFILSGFIQIGPNCSAAGTLPIQGLSAELVTATGREIPITVDGAAYYVEDLSRGLYLLRLTTNDGVQADFSLDFSDQGAGEFCEKHITRNISVEELREGAYTIVDGKKVDAWELTR